MCTRPQFYANINDLRMRAAVAFANSRGYNSHSLESYWYGVYRRAFKEFEECDDRITMLYPEFTVTRTFRPEDDSTYRPRPSVRRKGDPQEYLSKTDKNGNKTLTPINSYASYKHQDTQEEDGGSPTRQDGGKDDKKQRRWRIPDFVVLASPYPKHTAALVGDNPLATILVPSLPESAVIVPVIIEIKRAGRSNDITTATHGLSAVLFRFPMANRGHRHC